MFDAVVLPEVSVVTAAADATLIDVIRSGARVESAVMARRLAAIAELFTRRLNSVEAGEREQWLIDGHAEVTAEVAAALGITRRRAEALIHSATALCERLPQVAAVFATGAVDYRVIAAVVSRTNLIIDDADVARIDAALAPRLSRLGRLSAKKLAAVIDQLVVSVDVLAKKPARDRDTDRGIEINPDCQGMAEVQGVLRGTDALAFIARLDALAATVCRHDPRTAMQRRADAVGALADGRGALACLCDRDDCPAASPDPAGTSIVIHVLTHTTNDQTDPPVAEAAGAATVEPDTSPDTVPDTGTDPSAGQPAPSNPTNTEPTPATAAEPATDTGTAGDAAVEPAADTPEPTPNPGPASATPTPPPKRSARNTRGLHIGAQPGYVPGYGFLTPEAMTELAATARVVPLIHPGNTAPEKGYRPSAALADFIRARDLTCRFPGCDAPAEHCDIDHTRPWPTGPTHASNLKLLCRLHHLLKTYWSGQHWWNDQQLPDGTIIWTAPTGHTYRTEPHGALFFPDLAVPTPTLTLPPEPTTTIKPADNAHMPRRTRTRSTDRQARIHYQRSLNAAILTNIPPPPPPDPDDEPPF